MRKGTAASFSSSRPPASSSYTTAEKRGTASWFLNEQDATLQQQRVVVTRPIVPKVPATSMYRYAMICSSNINRSMEGHVVLQNHGFQVESYGCGTKLSLPGPNRTPRHFDFGTPYAEITACLEREGKGHYERMGGNEGGVLELASRGAATKAAPERWQDAPTSKLCKLDVVIVFETRLYDIVVSDLQERDPVDFSALHVILMHTKDAPNLAVSQAQNVLELCYQIEGVDLSAEIPAGTLKRADRGEIQYMLVHI